LKHGNGRQWFVPRIGNCHDTLARLLQLLTPGPNPAATSFRWRRATAKRAVVCPPRVKPLD